MAFANNPMLFLDDAAPALLRAYFTDGDDGPAFTGSAFDRVAVEGNDPDRVTAADVIAVQALSVPVPPRVALWLLGPASDRLHELLAQIPDDVDLWAADEAVIEDQSAADLLWKEIEKRPGAGWVTAGKLCARKRPRLLPVYDSVVQVALALPKGESFWRTLRQTLVDQPGIVARLTEIRAEDGIPDELALLRVLDIAIWMRNHGKAFTADPMVRDIKRIPVPVLA